MFDLNSASASPCEPVGDAVEVIETIPVSLLVQRYWSDLGIDVAREFNGIETLELCRNPASGRIYFDPPVTGSAAFYRDLQRFDWYYPDDKFEYTCAARRIGAGHSVLDVGCGAGHFAALVPEANYTGLELDAIAAEAARRRGLDVRRETLEQHVAAVRARYDAVCAFQILEHIADPDGFVAAARQCLKPGGLMILAVPSAESYITAIPNFVLNAPPHHVTWWTDAALRDLAARFGLTVVSVDYAPVEAWERRLYWMYRFARALVRRPDRHFTGSTASRALTVMCYGMAGLAEKLLRPPVSARGATVIMTARNGL